MYGTSNDYKSKIYEASTRHLLKIYINDIEIDKKCILDCKPSQPLFNNDELKLGSVTSQAIELKLYKTAVPATINKIYIASGITGEIVPVGYFNVDEINKDDDFTVTLKLLDNMIKFEFNYDGSRLTYPCSMLTVLQDICLKAGVDLGATSFLNMNKQVAVYDNTVSARTYISYIAEQAGGFACIGRDGKLYIRTIGEYTAEIPLKYFQNYKWGEKFKVTRIRYEDGVQLFEKGDTTGNTVYINQENMYIVDQEQIDNIYNQLNGLEVYSFEGDCIIDPALDVGDLLLIDGKYVIYQGSSQYGGKFKASISSKIQIKAKEETMTRIPSQKVINRRVQSQIDQVEGKIEQTISEVDGQNEKISKVTQTVDELRSQISEVAEMTTSADGYGSVSLEGINESEPIRIVIRPVGEDIAYLYPRNNLYPSNDLYLKNRKLRFATSTYSIDWELPADLLYYDAENYDELILDYEGQRCEINKKVGYNADGSKYLLDNPTTISYSYPKIPLEAGDYTVTLLGYTGAYLFARLMTQNMYTTQFATKAEMNSAITQTSQEINLSVDKKLSNYTTTIEMNAMINLKADSIISSVSATYETKKNASNTYATKTQLSTVQSEIKQTTDNIIITVSKKVGTDEIISSINQSAEAVRINASKISLSGKEINLTGDNVTIKSTNFSVDESGNITAKSGTIGGWNISNVALWKVTDNYIFEIRTDRPVNEPSFLVWDTVNSRSNFYISPDGYMYARNAEINGTINATSGTFKNCTITSSCSVQGSAIVGTLSGVTINAGKFGGSEVNAMTVGADRVHVNNPALGNCYEIGNYEGKSTTVTTSDGKTLKFVGGILVSVS